MCLLSYHKNIEIVQKFLQAIEQEKQSEFLRYNFNTLIKTQVHFQKSTSQAFDPQW